MVCKKRHNYQEMFEAEARKLLSPTLRLERIMPISCPIDGSVVYLEISDFNTSTLPNL